MLEPDALDKADVPDKPNELDEPDVPEGIDAPRPESQWFRTASKCD